MARFRKELIRPAKYLANGKLFEATPDRIDHWYNQVRAMKARGIHVPLSIGHIPDAVPRTQAEHAALEESKARAIVGYLDDVEKTDDGRVFVLGDAPAYEVDLDSGCLVNRATGHAVKEVSGGFWQNWVDGSGNAWQDVLTHVALVPLPVVPGQSGFTPLATMPSEFYTLSTLSADMDTDNNDDTTNGGGDTSKMKQAIQLLKEKKGINLPENCTADDVWDHIITALMNHPDDDDTKDQKTDPTNVTPPKEEQAPMTLSTISSANLATAVTDPVLRALVGGRLEELTARRTARIEALAKRGVPVRILDRLRKQAAAEPVALLSTGSVASSPVDAALDALEDAFPQDSQLLSTLTSRGGEQPLPEIAEVGGAPMTKDRVKALANQLVVSNGNN